MRARGLGLGEVDWTSVATGRPEDASCARDGGSAGRYTGCLLLALLVGYLAVLVLAVRWLWLSEAPQKLVERDRERAAQKAAKEKKVC